jgi:sterol desaturase/sphingolipid hydroxylase (fatty acid hydroxylase superfamily)
MHRVHHSADPTETNTNFVYLVVVDRFLGTYRGRPKSGHDAMTIGVEGFAAHAVLSLRPPVDAAASECPFALIPDTEGFDHAVLPG